MSSIGFFNPLIRIFKSFYSIEKNSNSGMKYNYIKHLGYEHLQSASNNDIKINIKSTRPKKVKSKLQFFREEITDVSSHRKMCKRAHKESYRNQSLNFVENSMNKTILSYNHSNILTSNETNSTMYGTNESVCNRTLSNGTSAITGVIFGSVLKSS